MPRITKELLTAKALVEEKGAAAAQEARAKANRYEAEGYRPQAISWRDIAAWCDAIHEANEIRARCASPARRAEILRAAE